MAEKGFICPVCDEKIGFLDGDFPQDGIEVHTRCLGEFFQDPEMFGGKAIEKTEAQIKAEKEATEQRGKEREEKSVYIKGGVNVESFDMPFGEMVEFMVKWAVASIPAFIILFIIFGIFFAIFGSLFF